MIKQNCWYWWAHPHNLAWTIGIMLCNLFIIIPKGGFKVMSSISVEVRAAPQCISHFPCDNVWWSVKDSAFKSRTKNECTLEYIFTQSSQCYVRCRSFVGIKTPSITIYISNINIIYTRTCCSLRCTHYRGAAILYKKEIFTYHQINWSYYCCCLKAQQTLTLWMYRHTHHSAH